MSDNIKLDAFITHVKTLDIDELKEKLDIMIETHEKYKDDPLLRLFNPFNYKIYLAKKIIVEEELDKRIEEELLGD